jgi:hypothetical protein
MCIWGMQYGTIRVYEWGPEKGRKILFLHGITTPCVALGGGYSEITFPIISQEKMLSNL